MMYELDLPQSQYYAQLMSPPDFDPWKTADRLVRLHRKDCDYTQGLACLKQNAIAHAWVITPDSKIIDPLLAQLDKRYTPGILRYIPIERYSYERLCDLAPSVLPIVLSSSGKLQPFSTEKDLLAQLQYQFAIKTLDLPVSCSAAYVHQLPETAYIAEIVMSSNE